MTTEVRVEGLAELDAQMAGLIRSMAPSKVEPVLLEGAKVVASAARALAPRGPTGNLKKACKAKLLKRRGGAGGILGFDEGNPAPAIAAVDRRIAPHAHLVEYGTGERIGGPKSRRYRGKRFGRMPARPFLRPAWDANKRGVQENIIAKLRQNLDEAVG